MSKARKGNKPELQKANIHNASEKTSSLKALSILLKYFTALAIIMFITHKLVLSRFFRCLVEGGTSVKTVPFTKDGFTGNYSDSFFENTQICLFGNTPLIQPFITKGRHDFK